MRQTIDSITLGDKIKRRRQEMNLSLKEIETATSIRSNFLQAIEENKILKMIPPVYAQGFIKQYALFMGMDSDHLLKEYPELSQKPGSQEFNYGIGTLEMRNTQVGSVKWIPNAMWIGILAVVLLAAWYFARLLEVI